MLKTLDQSMSRLSSSPKPESSSSALDGDVLLVSISPPLLLILLLLLLIVVIVAVLTVMEVFDTGVVEVLQVAKLGSVDGECNS